jgi:hypothetical protein
MVKLHGLSPYSLFPKQLEKFGSHLEIAIAASVPFADNMRCGGIQTSNVVQPAEAGFRPRLCNPINLHWPALGTSKPKGRDERELGGKNLFAGRDSQRAQVKADQRPLRRAVAHYAAMLYPARVLGDRDQPGHARALGETGLGRCPFGSRSRS